MTSHTGRTFLNTCLKVPIDPCNNCPAPIYNRPKMYLGRLSSTTPISANIPKISTSATKNSTIDFNSIWTNNAVRSMTDFYDSIPDYCDINHLSEEEFYSTLDSLKTTCRELKSQSIHSCFIEETTNSSSTVSTQQSTYLSMEKSKKSIKKKKPKSGSKKKSSHCKEPRTGSFAQTPCLVNYKNNFIDHMRLKSYREEFPDEIQDIKETLRAFEHEIKDPVTSKINKTTSVIGLKQEKAELKNPWLPSKPTFPRTTCRLAQLGKSLSCNDLYKVEGFYEVEDAQNLEKKNELKHKLSKAETLVYKDCEKLSNYFSIKSKADTGKERCSSSMSIPRITVESPSSENFYFNSENKKKSLTRSKKSSSKLGPVLTVFDLKVTREKDINNAKPNPSPVHPVSRPNLAATLRAEVSKKKLREKHNNCTYHDSATPQSDWEVRKTPAWKSLALNESHKEIIAIRLATRKAEQALQQREYDLNMELMRQRVKSAPLLLEGVTYWAPSVGKLTHSCKQSSLKNTCQQQIKQRKQRRKSANATERRLFECEASPSRAESVLSSNKIHSLRTIYASSTQSYARNPKSSNVTALKQTARPDSGDDLSSGDRAYL